MLCATSKIRLFWRRYPSYCEAGYGNGNRHSLINSNYYYDLFKYGMNMPCGKWIFSVSLRTFNMQPNRGRERERRQKRKNMWVPMGRCRQTLPATFWMKLVCVDIHVVRSHDGCDDWASRRLHAGQWDKTVIRMRKMNYNNKMKPFSREPCRWRKTVHRGSLLPSRRLSPPNRVYVNAEQTQWAHCQNIPQWWANKRNRRSPIVHIFTYCHCVWW